MWVHECDFSIQSDSLRQLKDMGIHDLISHAEIVSPYEMEIETLPGSEFFV